MAEVAAYQLGGVERTRLFCVKANLREHHRPGRVGNVSSKLLHGEVAASKLNTYAFGKSDPVRAVEHQHANLQDTAWLTNG